MLYDDQTVKCALIFTGFDQFSTKMKLLWYSLYRWSTFESGGEWYSLEALWLFCLVAPTDPKREGQQSKLSERWKNIREKIINWNIDMDCKWTTSRIHARVFVMQKPWSYFFSYFEWFCPGDHKKWPPADTNLLGSQTKLIDKNIWFEKQDPFVRNGYFPCEIS